MPDPDYILNPGAYRHGLAPQMRDTWTHIRAPQALEIFVTISR